MSKQGKKYVDAVRRYDAAAFHEAFADVVALLQHFSIRDAVLEHLRRTRGLLYRKDLRPVVALAVWTAPARERWLTAGLLLSAVGDLVMELGPAPALSVLA